MATIKDIAQLAGVSHGTVSNVLNGRGNVSMQKILQSGDYAPAEKKRSQKEDTLSTAYWLIVTAAYLAWSFVTGNWKETWIVWPVAGVLFAAVLNLYRLFTKSREE